MTKVAKQKLCFVIMPFHPDLMPVFNDAIRPACRQTGFKALRVDELEGVYNINREIIEHIFMSDAIIADLTNWRPNVFYELGVAHAISNKAIMIINKKDEIPFDIKMYSCILYEQNKRGLAKLAASLVKSLNSLDVWRQEPANPVQDHNPTICIPKRELEVIRGKLHEKEELLRLQDSRVESLHKKIADKDRSLQSSNAALSKMHKKLLTKENLLKNAPTIADIKALEKKLKQKEAETAALEKEIKKVRALLRR